jgi:chromosome segregation ATPase
MTTAKKNEIAILLVSRIEKETEDVRLALDAARARLHELNGLLTDASGRLSALQQQEAAIVAQLGDPFCAVGNISSLSKDQVNIQLEQLACDHELNNLSTHLIPAAERRLAVLQEALSVKAYAIAKDQSIIFTDAVQERCRALEAELAQWTDAFDQLNRQYRFSSIKSGSYPDLGQLKISSPILLRAVDPEDHYINRDLIAAYNSQNRPGSAPARD